VQRDDAQRGRGWIARRCGTVDLAARHEERHVAYRFTRSTFARLKVFPVASRWPVKVMRVSVLQHCEEGDEVKFIGVDSTINGLGKDGEVELPSMA
jgi:hypothetical protein